MNKSKLEVNTCEIRKRVPSRQENAFHRDSKTRSIETRKRVPSRLKNAFHRVTTGFDFTSDWMTKSGMSFFEDNHAACLRNKTYAIANCRNVRGLGRVYYID